MAEELKAASYLENNDELEKNFDGQRNSYKRLPRKLGTNNLDQNSELQSYQGIYNILFTPIYTFIITYFHYIIIGYIVCECRPCAIPII